MHLIGDTSARRDLSFRRTQRAASDSERSSLWWDARRELNPKKPLANLRKNDVNPCGCWGFFAPSVFPMIRCCEEKREIFVPNCPQNEVVKPGAGCIKPSMLKVRIIIMNPRPYDMCEERWQHVLNDQKILRIMFLSRFGEIEEPGEVDRAGLMPARDRVTGPAQILRQIHFHLGCRLAGHRVQVLEQCWQNRSLD
jgi:hypothetical protein